MLKAPLSSASKEFWDAARKSYAIETRAAFERTLPLYQELKKLQVPFIDYLENLGFSFEGSGRIPESLDSIYEKISRRAEEIKAAGFETLFPYDFLTLKDNRVRVYLFNGEIPDLAQGSVRFSNAVEIGRYFSKYLSQGFFPLGAHVTGVVGRQATDFLHNLGHFYAIQTNPNAYDLIIKRTRELRARVASGSMSAPDFRRYRDRFFILVEGLSVVAPEMRAKLWKILPVPEGRNPSAQEIVQNLKSLSDKELIRKSRDLLDQIVPLIQRVGGGFSEPSTVDVAFRAITDQPLPENMPHWEGAQAQETVMHGAPYESARLALMVALFRWREGTNTDRIRLQLARFSRRLIDLSQIDTEEWINTLLSPDFKISETNPLHQAFGGAASKSGYLPSFYRQIRP